MHKRSLERSQEDGLPWSIEHHFDIPFVAGVALREKQIQQNYRSIITVHKCLAGRPGTLFRALFLAAFGNRPVRRGFFRTERLPRPKSGRSVHGWWHDGVPSQHDGKDAAAAVNRVEVRR